MVCVFQDVALNKVFSIPKLKICKKAIIGRNENNIFSLIPSKLKKLKNNDEILKITIPK